MTGFDFGAAAEEAGKNLEESTITDEAILYSVQTRLIKDLETVTYELRDKYSNSGAIKNDWIFNQVEKQE